MERADEGVPQRALLRGRGEEILVLVVKESTKLQLKEWLRLPLELSPADAAFLLERNQCCHLRGKGEELLEVVMDCASDEQWCKWLQIPLENALIAGKTSLVQPLLAAGAGLARAVIRRDSGNGNDAGRGAAAAAAATSARDQETSACSASSSSSSSCRVDHLAPASPTSSEARHAAAAPVATSSSAASSCCPSPDPRLAAAVSPAAAAVSPAAAAAAAAAAVSSPSCRSTRGTGCNGSTPGRSASSRSVSSPSPSASPSTGTESSGRRGRSRGAGGPASPREAELDSLSLHRATMARDSGRMRELLAAGVDRNATDLWSCTALHRAAEQVDGCAEHVRLLLAAGLDVRAKDMEGYTPLHFAAARGAETAVVDLIAAESCLAERGINGDTPLHSAVRFLSLATVRILLESDADEAAVNGDGETPSDVMGVLPDGRDIENQPDPLVVEAIKALLEAAPQERRTRVQETDSTRM